MTDTSPTTPLRPTLFALGQIVATPESLAVLAAHGVAPASLLERHVSGNWGDLAPEDAAANDAALTLQDRLLSAYVLAPEVRIWVITEHDRSVTTILLPEQY